MNPAHEQTIVHTLVPPSRPGMQACSVEDLVQTALRFRSEISLGCNGRRKVSAKSLLAVLEFCSRRLEDLTIVIQGSDAEAAMEAMSSLCRSGILECYSQDQPGTEQPDATRRKGT